MGGGKGVIHSELSAGQVCHGVDACEHAHILTRVVVFSFYPYIQDQKWVSERVELVGGR